MKETDERMNITSRTFDMIKIIKLYSWEKLFKSKINEKRKIELDIKKKKANIEIIIAAMDWSVQDVLCMVCIIFNNLFYGTMELDKILTGFFVIEGFVGPLFCLPDFFIYLFEAVVSMRRSQDFLAIKYEYDQVEYFKDHNHMNAIEINNVDFGVEKNLDDKKKKDDDEEDDNDENDVDSNLDINNDNDNNNNKLIPKEIELEKIDHDDEEENKDNDQLLYYIIIIKIEFILFY